METVSDLQTHGLKFIQSDKFFPFGTDGVELANFVSGTPRDKAIDLGCGTGIVTVLLSGKKKIPTVGLELQRDVAELANRNVQLNSLNAQVINGDIRDIKTLFQSGSFTIVASNPPYRRENSGAASDSSPIRIARHEVAVKLTDVLDAAAYLLSTGGKFYMVHITERLDEVIAECIKRKLTPKVLQILRPSGKKPHLFLLKCLKDGKQGMEVLPERDVLGSTGVPYPEN